MHLDHLLLSLIYKSFSYLQDWIEFGTIWACKKPNTESKVSFTYFVKIL